MGLVAELSKKLWRAYIQRPGDPALIPEALDSRPSQYQIIANDISLAWMNSSSAERCQEALYIEE